MRIEANGVGLEVQDEGDGPAALLLHGWSDSHRLWRDQVGALTSAGFRTIAPDLRGFGTSDRPTEVEAYSLLTIAGDVLAVLDELGVTRAHVVGHDWGAAVAWMIATFTPDRVDHLAVLSVAIPAPCATPDWSSGRSRGTCCCSSSTASPSAGWRTTIGPTSGRGRDILTPTT
jgi:pimeloyl-ACP methyl ester carboxylesterase